MFRPTVTLYVGVFPGANVPHRGRSIGTTRERPSMYNDLQALVLKVALVIIAGAFVLVFLLVR